MAWTTIKTWLPEDPITSSDLNTYLRDNMNETVLARPSATNGGLAVASGLHEVTMRAPVQATKTTTSTTSSTSPVSVGPTTASISHSGRALVLFKATIRIQTAGALAHYSVGINSGSLVSANRAVINSDTRSATLSAHYIAYGFTSPTVFAGFLWTSNGANTAEITDAVITVQPL